MNNTHTHPKTEDLAVYCIPADSDTRMSLGVIHNQYQSLQNMVKGYIEIVRTEYMPELSCGCRIVMVVNEEGRLKGLEQNIRAGVYYPHAPIVGDAILVGEGLVKSPWDEEAEPDFFSLPPEFNHWEGPGHPIPTPAVMD